MVIKLNILNTDAKCSDIKGAGIRVRQSKKDLWLWEHVYTDGRDGPTEFGFNSKEDAIENIRQFKRDLSNDDLPIYVCIGDGNGY